MAPARTFWREPVIIHLWTELLFVLATFVLSIFNLIESVHLLQDAQTQVDRQATRNQFCSETNYANPLSHCDTPEDQAGRTAIVQELLTQSRRAIIVNAFLVLALFLRFAVGPAYITIGALHAKRVRMMQNGAQEMTPLDASKRTRRIRLAFLLQVIIYFFLVAGLGAGSIVVGSFNGILFILWIITIIASIILCILAGLHYGDAPHGVADFQPVRQQEALGSAEDVRSRTNTQIPDVNQQMTQYYDTELSSNPAQQQHQQHDVTIPDAQIRRQQAQVHQHQQYPMQQMRHSGSSQRSSQRVVEGAV